MRLALFQNLQKKSIYLKKSNGKEKSLYFYIWIRNKFKINYKEYKNAQNAIKNTDALIICTEWKEFWSVDPSLFPAMMSDPVIFDGRNIYEPDQMKQHNITYIAIGRGYA